MIRTCKKNVACLEMILEEDIEKRLNVFPILELISKIKDLKFIYLTCNTKMELIFNLNLLKKRRGYGILYLSAHGRPGEIDLHETQIDLETLAALMGRNFKGWAIHFGSCRTIDVAKNRIYRFIDATDVSIVLGYTKNIYWIDSGAADLLLLGNLQSYKNMQKFWEAFKKRYIDLIKLTGLKAFPK
jgi:hypothetical protein